MAAGKTEKFVPSTFGLTQRHTATLRRVADHRQISVSEQLRRVLDDWVDRQNQQAQRQAQSQ